MTPMQRGIAQGVGTAAFAGLIELLLLGFQQIVIKSPFDLNGNVAHTPVWSLILFPIIIGAISFAEGYAETANKISKSAEARVIVTRNGPSGD